jgi:hypothetical protein
MGTSWKPEHRRVAKQSNRMESALYWAAVSLIVCEGLPIDKAAEQLGLARAQLREILHRRQMHRLPEEARWRSASAVVVPFPRH